MKREKSILWIKSILSKRDIPRNKNNFRKWMGLRLTAGLCAALGWWGLLYPELALTPGTVVIDTATQKGTSGRESRNRCFDDNLYLELLNADRDQITFQSKLLTDLGSFWEALHERNQKQDQSK